VSLILPFQASIDTVRNTTKELHNVATQNAANNEVNQLRPAPSNSRKALFDVAVKDTRLGAKGSRKRNNQCLQEVATVTDDDGGSGKQAGGSCVVRVVAAVDSGKHQA
jgi:hypothetical protein